MCYLPYIALASLGLVIYSNTFHVPFQYDDIPAIVKNPYIQDLFNLKAIADAFNTRFLVGLSLALNYSLGRLDVLGYHVFNIAVHVVASFLVYQLSLVTFKTPALSGHTLLKHQKSISFFISLIFLTHPIQTQAVTYIWQRAASLAAIFYISSLVFYAKARLESSRLYYGTSFGLAAIGMFTKETMITVPLTLALYELCFLGNLKESKPKRFYSVLPFLFLFSVIPLTLMRAPQNPL